MPRPKNSVPKLSDREAQIMSMLWEYGPLFVREMLEHYDDPRPHFNTVSTTVRILEDKGYVGHESVGGSHRYYAIAKQSDFATRSLSQIVSNYFSNSYSKVVSALVEEEKISVEELQSIIDMVNNRKKSD